MKALPISYPESMIPALHDEIRRYEQSRYGHLLHGVLRVARGMTFPQAAAVLGDAPRTVEYWVRRFETDGFVGLADGERPRGDPVGGMSAKLPKSLPPRARAHIKPGREQRASGMASPLLLCEAALRG